MHNIRASGLGHKGIGFASLEWIAHR